MRWRLIDQIAAITVVLVGALHLVVGAGVLTRPTERGVWFFSAGLLGVTAGLANLARAGLRQPSALVTLAALSGSLSLAVIGLLLAAAMGSAFLTGPSIVVLCLALLLAAFGMRDLVCSLRHRASRESDDGCEK